MKKIIFMICIIVISIFSLSGSISIGKNLDLLNEHNILSSTSLDINQIKAAWPMFGHDARHTSHSPFGQSGGWWNEKWSVFIGNCPESSPAIDNDGVIYLGGGINDRCLHAINPNGTKKWSFKTAGQVQSSPAISEDGTIYVGSNDGKLYAIYPNGTERWSLTIGDGWVYSSPVIDEDGNIYVASVNGENICAVYPNGTKKWDFKTGGRIYSSPAIDSDTVYCGSQDYYFYALHIDNGTLKWRYKAKNQCGGDGATISDDGTIYFGDVIGHLYALNSNGTLKWRLELGVNVVSSPALADDGSIYVAAYKAMTNAYIYSINADGDINWRYEYLTEYISSSPAIDKYGIIYFGTWDGYLLAMNPDGTLRWSINGLDYILSSPAIGEDGTIYIASWDQKLHAIEPVEGNSPPEMPIISGPKQVSLLREYTYTFKTIDPDGDKVCFYVEWDEFVESEWTDFVSSGSSTKLSHKFEYLGLPYYRIKVRAWDEQGAWSDWTTYQVNFKPRIRGWLRFLDMFPILQRILNFG